MVERDCVIEREENDKSYVNLRVYEREGPDLKLGRTL